MLTINMGLQHEIVKYCAPTLAGLKSASLFNIAKSTTTNLYEQIREINRHFTVCNIRVIPLYEKNERILIYVYRPDFLEKDLVNELSKTILFSDDIHYCLSMLRQRMANNREYPHEIGLFLGYPPEDVYGFIYHRDEDLKVKGYWRVYNNAKHAKELFNQFDRCTKCLLKRLANGYTLEDLIVKVN